MVTETFSDEDSALRLNTLDKFSDTLREPRKNEDDGFDEFFLSTSLEQRLPSPRPVVSSTTNSRPRMGLLASSTCFRAMAASFMVKLSRSMGSSACFSAWEKHRIIGQQRGVGILDGDRKMVERISERWQAHEAEERGVMGHGRRG
ncbi:hypothetical protein BWQ96_07111 [Gracilariopsis chorda]|uniref:Uncharacterized protein n=1 Tax=Gracilariopsis chorda TaxID=448386 RepID=A0A2V3IM91_9FLOR|nr:hypothetical protein BWQ96_07111 [Gracilariopsis chorda]|eukprot:PXF43167.1 hypothetical protein BWQ96_07111 [Gracilariopsis chorda]